ncbi:hypothetical protein HUB98_05535 [Paenibacillus barcinonensis]|uniref:Uncharacterized protein n=1 Tax=Paenibacillus barcinonensis TaxID=198119 RepID=A0A2V4VCZ9_PAEBA|nr:hypothetical protein [Paenibacillus barcinonensis]PYE51452.1 hypothetical protein DFQ00_102246 [Paenibacillus barcinonensis]QKS55844.1 hypothetical protein HUB98_05535 [Paenibacillus barcinonensis]
MMRYTYLYEVVSTGEKSEFSQEATSKEEAAELIVARIADLEFTDESDIKLGKVIAISKKVGDNYIACEGCAS